MIRQLRLNRFTCLLVMLASILLTSTGKHWLSLGSNQCVAAELSQTSSAIPVRVELKLLSGVTTEGELQSIQDGIVKVRTRVDNKIVAIDFPVVETAMVTLASALPVDGIASVDVLKLSDGTTIHCRSISGKDNTWSVESESNLSINMSPSIMVNLQFRNLNKSVRDAAGENAGVAALTDEMLIIRPGDQIDRIPGVILGLDETSVSFSFDGQTIPAPRAKLAGLVWAQPEVALFNPTIRIRTLDGSKWEATDLVFLESGKNGPMFRWNLRGGIECTCKPEQIASIDFSNAIVRWLASIPVLESKAFDNPFLSVLVRGRSILLAPHFAALSTGLEVADEPSTKNLLFPVDGEIVARVPDGTTRFRTRIVRPDDAKIQDKIVCEIWSNEDLLWSSADTIANTNSEAPWVVDVAVKPEKRIRLVVRSNSKVSAGSMVTWLQPRFSP